MFLCPEDGRTAGKRIAADAFENRRAVIHNVRHHMQLGVIPGDEFPVMPDLRGLLDGHGRSLKIVPAVLAQVRRQAESRCTGEGRVVPGSTSRLKYRQL